MSDAYTGRVADAPSDIWVYRWLPKAVWPYAQLARWDRPIGWWLLMWPCLWSLMLAMGVLERSAASSTLIGGSNATAAVFAIILFWLGAVAMRGAGCTYNDLVDVDIDAKVSRTASRPIPSGRVTRLQSALFMGAQAIFGLLCLIGLSLLTASGFNQFAFWLAFASLAVVACYPFAKRVTHWPQFVLGLAFSWGALMGWVVVFGGLSTAAFLLYAGSVCWVIGYDTLYAHQDKEDDALIGVRSTARLFGDKTNQALIVLYSITLACIALAFVQVDTGWIAFAGIAVGSGHMIWQISALDIDDADKCLALFKSNSKFGWIVFIALAADWLF